MAHILTETGTRITTGNVYLMWYKTGDKGTRRTTQFGEGGASLGTDLRCDESDKSLVG